MPQLAADLLLIGRNPLSGRLRHRSALEKGLRAALFVELILARRIGDSGNCPAALTTDPLDDKVLDAVLGAVARRPGVTWRRWYHHVAADRAILTKALVADGRWRRERDRLGRPVWRDTDQGATLATAHAVTQVAELRQAPLGQEQAVLAILSAMCGAISGRPRPRDLRGRLDALLAAVGPSTDAGRRDIDAALRGCAASVRHRTRLVG
jgi:Golgi phosphoprotein 3 (GPP34)